MTGGDGAGGGKHRLSASRGLRAPLLFAWRTGVTSPRLACAGSERSILEPWSGLRSLSILRQVGSGATGVVGLLTQAVASPRFSRHPHYEPSGRPVSVFSFPFVFHAGWGRWVGGKVFHGRAGRSMPWVSLRTRRQKPRGWASSRMRSRPPEMVSPFALEHGPGVERRRRRVRRAGAWRPRPSGREVGDLVFDEAAHQAEVAAGAGEDAVLAVGFQRVMRSLISGGP